MLCLFEPFFWRDIDFRKRPTNESPASDKDECFREMILIQFASTNLFPIYSPLSLQLTFPYIPSLPLFPSLPTPSLPVEWAILCSPCLDVLICHYKKGYSRKHSDIRCERWNAECTKVESWSEETSRVSFQDSEKSQKNKSALNILFLLIFIKTWIANRLVSYWSVFNSNRTILVR